MVHHAKVDRWLAIWLGGTALIGFGTAVILVLKSVVTGSPDLAAAIGPALIVGFSSLMIGLLLRACYRTRYEITPPHLHIRFGPFRTTLPLADIIEVFPTHNPLSAPAPSLARLRINYRRKNGRQWFALISPRDREAFIRDLASVAPHLRSTGPGPSLRLQATESAESR